MQRIIFSLLLVTALVAPASASALDDVKRSMDHLESAKTFHSTMTINGMTIESDTVRPNRFHVKSPMFEAIMLPDAMYMKQQGKWTKLPASAASMTNLMSVMEKAKADVKKGNFTATDLGMKPVGGTLMHAYRVVSMKNGKPYTLYVNAQDLPARMEFATDRGVSVLTISQFNAPMRIDAPI